DEVVVMYAGVVVESGSGDLFHPAKVIPRHPYTRALLECDPARVSGRRRKLPVIPATCRTSSTRREAACSRRAASG
ncbi:MAG: hypothetical protein M5U09_25385, partial [Gammaproteobacteria bacterium]|nr:hypothetical protein [Gammaproteobacteria bacterium]